MRARHLSPLTLVFAAALLTAPAFVSAEPDPAPKAPEAVSVAFAPFALSPEPPPGPSDIAPPLLRAHVLRRGEAGTQRYSGGRAVTRPFETLGRLHLWAEGGGYALGRVSSAFDLEGGASYPLASRLALTARYRLLGLGAARAQTLSTIAYTAPYVGFELDF